MANKTFTIENSKYSLIDTDELRGLEAENAALQARAAELEAEALRILDIGPALGKWQYAEPAARWDNPPGNIAANLRALHDEVLGVPALPDDPQIHNFYLCESCARTANYAPDELRRCKYCGSSFVRKFRESDRQAAAALARPGIELAAATATVFKRQVLQPATATKIAGLPCRVPVTIDGGRVIGVALIGKDGMGEFTLATEVVLPTALGTHSAAVFEPNERIETIPIDATADKPSILFILDEAEGASPALWDAAARMFPEMLAQGTALHIGCDLARPGTDHTAGTVLFDGQPYPSSLPPGYTGPVFIDASGTLQPSSPLEPDTADAPAIVEPS